MSGRNKSVKSATKKERKFAEGVAAGKSQKQSALDAGYSFSMAENANAKILSKPEVQEYFRRLMRAAAPPQRIVDKISEHIEGKVSTTRVRRKMGPPDANGKRAVLEEIVEKVETVDAGVSLRALEMAIQGAGYVPKEDITTNPLTLIQIEGDAVVVQKLLGD